MGTLLRMLLSGVLLAAGPDQETKHRHGETSERPEPEFDGQPGSITGHIRDAACLLRNPAAGAPDDAVTLDCARSCVRAGSPLVLFTTERKMYLILSDTIPDTSQNAKFLPYVGKLVKVSGRVFERDGVHAIAIRQVEIVPTAKPNLLPLLRSRVPTRGQARAHGRARSRSAWDHSAS